MSREFLNTLRAHGLEPPSDIEPGKLYRFPGLNKRRGNTAGWCKLFPDGFGGVFGDFSRDFSETWQAKKQYTPEEREAFRRQVEEARHQREEKEAAEAARARERLSKEWDAAQPESGAHHYLRKKGVKAYGIRTNGYELLIPLRDNKEILHGLQSISPAGNKKLRTGTKKQGRYHLIGKPDGMLYIAEGYSTSASVHEAVGAAVAVAFDCGNLLPVAEALRRKYPEIEIIFAADNDAFTGGNPGVTAATKAAEAIGGKLAIPTFKDISSKPTDFNDLHQQEGLETVRQQLEGAKMLEENETVAKEALPRAEIHPPCFAVHDTWCQLEGKTLKPGLYWHESKESELGTVYTHTWISSPIQVEAITRDTQGSDYGRLLRFLDSDHRWREWAMPMRLLKGSGEELRGELLDQGVLINPKARSLLVQYLMSEHPKHRITAANRVGWDGDMFVLPHRCLGPGEVVFQSELLAEADYTQKGSLEGWQQNIGRLCEGNPALILAVSAALAGPLLFRVGLAQGAGIHFLGDSSKGKSTALEVAASVWSSYEFIQSWSNTANGLEGIAAARNDTCLVLDEINEASPHEIGRIVYMIANGRGKGRANRIGRARAIQRWRVIALSSGERTLSAMMAEIGRKVNAGQSVKLLNIPATDFKHGAFECLHDFPSGQAFSEHLKEARHKDHGHVGPAFIEGLIKEECSLHERFKTLAAELSTEAKTELEGRAASMMALFALAGELGIEYGLLPWSQGASRQAVHETFLLWCESQGEQGNEDAQILQSVQDFLDRHGDSRFQPKNQDPADSPLIRDRAGWYEWDGDGRIYLFHSSGLKEAGGGFDVKRVAKALMKAGWIVDHYEGRFTKSVRINGKLEQSLYVVKPIGSENPINSVNKPVTARAAAVYSPFTGEQTLQTPSESKAEGVYSQNSVQTDCKQPAPLSDGAVYGICGVYAEKQPSENTDLPNGKPPSPNRDCRECKHYLGQMKCSVGKLFTTFGDRPCSRFEAKEVRR